MAAEQRVEIFNNKPSIPNVTPERKETRVIPNPFPERVPAPQPVGPVRVPQAPVPVGK